MTGTSGLARESLAAVISPCINICNMEEGLCIGCLRTLDEIACWANAADEDRRRILAAVAQRRAGSGPALP